MEEVKKQFILLCSLLIVLAIFVFVYKSDVCWNFAKGLPLHTNSGNCVHVNDRICLAEDAGLRVNYYEASSLCSKRGMYLPTLEDAWEIWIASENCQRTFASNQDVPRGKNYFKHDCGENSCTVPAKSIVNYCAESKIKFPLASQYKNGSFWLRDKSVNNQHYGVNFYSGRVGDYDDNNKSLGVRCVTYLNKKG